MDIICSRTTQGRNQNENSGAVRGIGRQKVRRIQSCSIAQNTSEVDTITI